MKLNKTLFLEKFVLLTFPIALAVGCTTPMEQSSPTNQDSIEQDSSQWISQNAGDEVNNFPTPETPVSTENHRGDTMPSKMSALTNEKDGNQSVSPEMPLVENNEGLLAVNLPASTEPPSNPMPPRGIIYFEVNKHIVSAADIEILKQHADYLKQNAGLILYVDGFSDNRGTASLNYQLSKKRAQQVADLLIRYGAPESRIRVNGYGESFPLTSETNWDENRRVELEYSNIGTTAEIYAGLK